MSTFDHDRKIMSFLNTPERLDRIKEFFCFIQIKTVDGVNTIVFNFSEEIVAEAHILNNASWMVEMEVTHRGEDAVKFLPGKLTVFFRDMLLYGGCKFADEAEADEVLSEDEVAYCDDEGIKIFKMSGRE